MVLTSIARRDKWLLVSTQFDSRIFQLDADGVTALKELSEDDHPALPLQQPTLAATNVGDSLVLHVNSEGARLVDVITGLELDRTSFTGGEQVTTACAISSPARVCLALRSGALVIYDVSDSSLRRRAVPAVGARKEIAAIAAMGPLVALTRRFNSLGRAERHDSPHTATVFGRFRAGEGARERQNEHARIVRTPNRLRV